MTTRSGSLGSFVFIQSSLDEAVAHSTSTGGTTSSPPTGTAYASGYYSSTPNYAQTWEHPQALSLIAKYLPNIKSSDSKKLVDIFETNARSLEDHLDIAYLKTSGGTVYGATTLAGDVNLIGTVRVQELPLVSLLPPVGSIMPYAGSAAPAGWLLCNGGEYSITTYDPLYSVIGSTYNTSTGLSAPASGYFRVPNLLGRMPVGLNSSITAFNDRGKSGGATTVALTAAQSGLPNHSHNVATSFVDVATGSTRIYPVDPSGLGAAYPATIAATADASSSHENMPPYLVLNYIIKT
jgi:hypothetical protein